MRVDIEEARRILVAEATSHEPVPDAWANLVHRLSEACATGPRTHIAMLGTAILAKATEPGVDVRTLKVSAGTPGAYSARNLAKEALAALAPSLGIDLGVTGREPLNNQPYFRVAHVDEIHDIIRGDGVSAFSVVLEGLAVLESSSRDEARAALRAFLQGRRRVLPPPLDPEIRIETTPGALADRIAEFVNANSEGGKRAQAVAAAALDAVFGVDRVQVDRVNDPDRHFPGDVGVKDARAPHSVVRVYEVRDKPVEEHDLAHFVEKAQAAGARWAGIAAVAGNQRPFELRSSVDLAFERGIALAVYFGWESLIRDVLFSAQTAPKRVVAQFGLSVYERLVEIEVSVQGLQRWAAIVRELQGDA